MSEKIVTAMLKVAAALSLMWFLGAVFTIVMALFNGSPSVAVTGLRDGLLAFCGFSLFIALISIRRKLTGIDRPHSVDE